VARTPTNACHWRYRPLLQRARDIPGTSSSLFLYNVVWLTRNLNRIIKDFVKYLPLEAYLALQLIFGTAHAVFTVAGIIRLQNGNSPIRLSSDSEHEYLHHRLNGADGGFKPLIPPPGRKETIKLAAIALGLSLLASVPLNLILK
jgi:hypothetical protein